MWVMSSPADVGLWDVLSGDLQVDVVAGDPRSSAYLIGNLGSGKGELERTQSKARDFPCHIGTVVG